MHRYTATITWEDSQNNFQTGQYSRAHSWAFDGGITVEASASPLVVRLPFSKAAAVDPEEAFVASIASCHMLTFLYLAGKAKFIIRKYADEAIGLVEKNAAGKEWVSRVELNPRIDFEGIRPSPAELTQLHELAHQDCFIANSVKTEIAVNQIS